MPDIPAPMQTMVLEKRGGGSDEDILFCLELRQKMGFSVGSGVCIRFNVIM